MSAIDTLVNHWKELDLASSVQIHPSDRRVLDNCSGFLKNLVPYPYVGDLYGADIWILMLNSNIGPDDVIQESHPYFAARLRDNLLQQLAGYDYRMLSMDPKLSETGTYKYYNQRNGIAKLVARLALLSGQKEEQARKLLAQRMAVVQLMPYRSTNGVPSSLLGDELLSVRLMRKAVEQAAENKFLVVPRCAKFWGFEYGVQTEMLFTYQANQARSASLSPGGKCGGGDAILKKILSQ